MKNWVSYRFLGHWFLLSIKYKQTLTHIFRGCCSIPWANYLIELVSLLGSCFTFPKRLGNGLLGHCFDRFPDDCSIAFWHVSFRVSSKNLYQSSKAVHRVVFHVVCSRCAIDLLEEFSGALNFYILNWAQFHDGYRTLCFGESVAAVVRLANHYVPLGSPPTNAQSAPVANIGWKWSKTFAKWDTWWMCAMHWYKGKSTMLINPSWLLGRIEEDTQMTRNKGKLRIHKWQETKESCRLSTV